jgi:signal transduction histidine kinase
MTTNQMGATHTPNIMIIDDTPANLQVLTEMLQKQPLYRIRPFSSGKLALQAMKKHCPDLILLDITMPEMDGYEVCRQIKQDPLFQDIPVLFISALNETVDKLKAFEVGGVDYITKPFQFEEVQARVHTHLQLRRQRRELQEACDQLERQRTLLMKSNTELRFLQEFRNNMTHLLIHDLRQPMTGVIGYLDLLEIQTGSQISDSGRSSLAKIRASTHRLIEMINSLLDISKMEAGKLQLVRTPSDLAALAREALAHVEPLRRDRILECVWPNALPMVAADTVLTVRVIENLIGNAMKFSSPTGKIVVTIEPDENFIRTMVSDNGPGIPPELHSRIFEKFSQVNGDNKQRLGTGLGLYFCKLAVEAHGGAIGVDSNPGQGCTFWFTLPLAAATLQES